VQAYYIGQFSYANENSTSGMPLEILDALWKQFKKHEYPKEESSIAIN
jgi:hypothetical protein